MAITIDWGTQVINVPRNDLTLVQAAPTEVRELDIDLFRQALKALEGSTDGHPFLDTHSNVTPVPLGGIELARIVEIINGYTVTFEDGQYAVNLVGANSNIGDVVNQNQVSIRSANSAGLVQTKDIEFASFEGGVWVDVNSTTSGTAFPAGTRRQPVNNLADAIIIAEYRGFYTVNVIGDLTIDSGANYDQYIFVGQSKDKTTLTISDAASVVGCEFYRASVQGTLDGGNVIRDCFVGDLNYVNGYVEDCVLGDATITLGGTNQAHFLRCMSGVPGIGAPTIDMGGDGPALAIRGYSGGIAIQNKTGADEVSIDLVSGRVILDPTITNGDFYIRGVGFVQDSSGGTSTVSTYGLVSNEEGAHTLLNEEIEGGYSLKQVLSLTGAVLLGEATGMGTSTVSFKGLDDTNIRVQAGTDENGNRLYVIRTVT